MGSRLIQIGLMWGAKLFYIKKFRGVSSLIARYILTGDNWPRWVKQLNSRVYRIYVKQYCSIVQFYADPIAFC